MSQETATGLSAPTALASVELAVGGMTCTSCAARVQKKLNRLDGVEATVNYATEKASVRYDPAKVGPAELVATVEQTGYTARLPQPRASRPTGDDGDVPDAAAAETADLRQRLLVSRRPDPAGARAGDGPGRPVRQLAMALADPGRPGRGLGRLAVPPRRRAEPAAPRRDDGHAGVAGHAGGLRLVAVRPLLRRRRDARACGCTSTSPPPPGTGRPRSISRSRRPSWCSCSRAAISRRGPNVARARR